MFLCVSFPVKVSHFTMFSFLACKKVEYETRSISSTPHVISTPTKNSVSLSSMIGINRLFART